MKAVAAATAMTILVVFMARTAEERGLIGVLECAPPTATDPEQLADERELAEAACALVTVASAAPAMRPLERAIFFNSRIPASRYRDTVAWLTPLLCAISCWVRPSR